jgi:hypothetical protein
MEDSQTSFAERKKPDARGSTLDTCVWRSGKDKALGMKSRLRVT